MPTSAPGTADSRGFTLLEILVVLVIVAVLAGLLVFAYRDNPQVRLRREAAGLAALLNLAADEAVMQNIELGLVIEDEGYRFVYFDTERNRWLPVLEKPLLEHTFQEPYEISFELDGERVTERERERIRQFSARTEDEADRPLLLLLSSGEITPFSLTLEYDPDHRATLRSDGFNPVAVETGPAEAG